MKYFSTDVFESKLLSGVKFRLRKMSQGRRTELNLATAPVFVKLQEIDRDRAPYLEEVNRASDAAKIEPCGCEHPAEQHDSHTGRCNAQSCSCREPHFENDALAKLQELNSREYEIRTNELCPGYIRWGVDSIEGLEIDDQPATVETFLHLMLEEPIFEVTNEIIRLSKLSFEEQMGFSSPTISGAQVDTGTPNSVAPAAGNTGSSLPAAAPKAA